MAPYHKAKVVAGCFLDGAHKVMFCWVVRAALLLLGVGEAYPQPSAHSFLI